MSFSIKQLLFCMAVIAFGLVALLSAKPVLGKLFDLLTLGILIAAAYGAWLSHGEIRAFRVGFLCWAVVYFFLVKKTFDVGIYDLIKRVHPEFQPMIVPPVGYGGGGFVTRFPTFYLVCHSLLLLLLGVIGGWVTVYFYRKRQRMHQSRE
jgi:hypothetical protein